MLVQVRHRFVTRVRPREAWQLLDPDVIAWQQEGPLREDFIRHLTEVREVLEPAAAALAARHATAADVAVIELAYRDMMAATDGKRVRLDRFMAGVCGAQRWACSGGVQSHQPAAFTDDRGAVPVLHSSGLPGSRAARRGLPRSPGTTSSTMTSSDPTPLAAARRAAAIAVTAGG